MIKLLGGGLALLLAALLIVWIGYNLFVERQKEFHLGGLGFLAALLFVGVKWVREGLGADAEPTKKRKKKMKSIR